MNMAWKATVATLLLVPLVSATAPLGMSLGFGHFQLETAAVPRVSGRGGATDWHTYWNDEYRFQIKYPPNFDLAKEPNTLVASGAVVTFTPASDPSIDRTGAKTNLIAFSVTVGVADCSVAPSQRSVSCLPCTPEHRLDGHDAHHTCFAGCYSAEGAVGNRYEKLSYVTHRGDRHYEIALFVHSGSPGCYAPGAIKVFDPAEVTRLFQTMVGTFLPETSGS